MRREEAKEHNRQRIVDAARGHFLREGFHNASLGRIADTAGFSTGVVYSQFGGKAELAMTVLCTLYAEETDRVLGLVTGQPEQTVEDWLAAVGDWAEVRVGDPDWGRFELELNGALSGQDKLKDLMSVLYGQIRERVVDLLSARSRDLELHGRSPEAVATLLLAVILGVGLQRTADPAVPARLVTEALRALLLPDRAE
nr:Transcriptional regulator, TetR family [Kibdelosporangium sp. MJ126-NF4]CTQ88371.1 Transcriptional regulator, TetR family [Kibdelosporangium sp. MJ126-NF4]